MSKELPPIGFKLGQWEPFCTLIEVDVEKLDALWRQDENSYIENSTSANVIGDRYNAFNNWFNTGQNKLGIEAPFITLYNDENIVFTNGRHRFAVLRDMGYKRVKVAVENAIQNDDDPKSEEQLEKEKAHIQLVKDRLNGRE